MARGGWLAGDVDGGVGGKGQGWGRQQRPAEAMVPSGHHLFGLSSGVGSLLPPVSSPPRQAPAISRYTPYEHDRGVPWTKGVA